MTLQERLVAVATRLFAEKGHEGTFRAGTPADIVVNFLFGTVHQIGAWYRPGGRLKAEEVGEHHVGLLLDGLLAHRP
ncbi:hypothetical protein AB0L06_15055 [Spirillospora sp. NPDC052269]